MSEYIFKIDATINEETREIVCQSKCVGEIIHCKDCKHFIKSINKGCGRRVGYFLPDDFCSYGERRESE